jgi:hypothetical protein
VKTKKFGYDCEGSNCDIEKLTFNFDFKKERESNDFYNLIIMQYWIRTIINIYILKNSEFEAVIKAARDKNATII